MNGLAIFLGMLFAASLLLYVYVWWEIRAKRRAMRIITITERRLYQTTQIAATIILFSALIVIGTVVLGA